MVCNTFHSGKLRAYYFSFLSKCLLINVPLRHVLSLLHSPPENPSPSPCKTISMGFVPRFYSPFYEVEAALFRRAFAVPDRPYDAKHRAA